jgi:hypothetical protein
MLINRDCEHGIPYQTTAAFAASRLKTEIGGGPKFRRVWRHAAGRSTEILCVSHAIEDLPIEIWVVGQRIPKPFPSAQPESQNG